MCVQPKPACLKESTKEGVGTEDWHRKVVGFHPRRAQSRFLSVATCDWSLRTNRSRGIER